MHSCMTPLFLVKLFCLPFGGEIELMRGLYFFIWIRINVAQSIAENNVIKVLLRKPCVEFAIGLTLAGAILSVPFHAVNVGYLAEPSY